MSRSRAGISRTSILLTLGVYVVTVVATIAAGPVARIQFISTAGQIEIPVRVNGVPATFLLDTAADYSEVSPRLLGSLKPSVERSAGRDFADDVTIDVGGVSLEHQRVVVRPFDSFVARGRNIHGRLGHDLFARFVTRIDFSAHTIELWPPSAFKAPKAAVAVPLEVTGRLVTIGSTIKLANGRSLSARLIVDTGAPQSVVLRYPFANENGLLDMGTGTRSSASEVPLADVPVDQVSIGRWTFDHPQVQAQRAPSGSGASTAADGLIGTGLLSRFTLTLDVGHRRLWLEPKRRSR
jgi:hypothetical protein